MTRSWKTLLPCLALPLGVGFLSSLLTRSAMDRFAALRQPPLSPPGWVFPLVWTVLYLLMGLSSYLVLTAGKGRPPGLGLYCLQLLFNFFWPLLFFGMGLYLPAFFWLLALWGLVLATAVQFSKTSRKAARLLLPYLAWTAFAGYLNLGVCLLNR